MRPTALPSPMPAMPATSVANTSGPMIILIIRMKMLGEDGEVIRDRFRGGGVGRRVVGSGAGQNAEQHRDEDQCGQSASLSSPVHPPWGRARRRRALTAAPRRARGVPARRPPEGGWKSMNKKEFRCDGGAAFGNPDNRAGSPFGNPNGAAGRCDAGTPSGVRPCPPRAPTPRAVAPPAPAGRSHSPARSPRQSRAACPASPRPPRTRPRSARPAGGRCR